MRIQLLVFCAAVTAAGTTPLIAQDTLGREPVSLLQVLDRVAARHPSLAAADARGRAARGSRSTAGTLGNPMLMYDVDRLAEAGVQPPRTHSELLNALRRLARDRDGDGRRDQWGLWAPLKVTWFERFFDFIEPIAYVCIEPVEPSLH